jgi:hypothetical protein
MLFKTGTEPLPSSPRSHRLDESAAGYSLTGCSPALPVSASPTGLYRQAEDVHLSSNSNGTGDSPLDFGAAAGQTINYQGGPNQMIEVGQAGRSNSAFVYHDLAAASSRRQYIGTCLLRDNEGRIRLL